MASTCTAHVVTDYFNDHENNVKRSGIYNHGNLRLIEHQWDILDHCAKKVWLSFLEQKSRAINLFICLINANAFQSSFSMLFLNS